MKKNLLITPLSIFCLVLALLALDVTAAGPQGINDCVLWLDAAQITGLSDGAQVSTWPDMSGAGNIATRGGGTAGYPQYKPNQLNGKPVVRFSTDAKSWFGFTNMTDIRTVFWVLKENTPKDADRPGVHDPTSFLLGDDDKKDFHRNGPWDFELWDSKEANVNILKGTTKLMGNVVDGAKTKLGAGYRLVSLVTAGNVEASRLSDDRGFVQGYGRSGTGDIAELIIYNRALTTTEENQVGYYLKQKYNLTAANYTPVTLSTQEGSPPVGSGNTGPRLSIQPARTGTVVFYIHPGQARTVALEIYGSDGHKIATLPGAQNSGKLAWDASAQPRGVYVARLATEAGSIARQFVLVK